MKPTDSKLFRAAANALDAVPKLQDELRQARKDTERLDWLTQFIAEGKFVSEPDASGNYWELGHNFGSGYHIYGQGDTLRQAIDEAMKDQSK